MRSKNDLTNLQSLSIAVYTLQLFIKKQCLKAIQYSRSSLSTISTKLFKYTGRANHRETKWLLQADHYVPDERKVPIVEDQEVRIKSNHIQGSPNCGMVRKFTERYSVKSGASSLAIKRSLIRGSSQMRAAVADKTLAPLNSSSSKSSLSSQDSPVINNFREQKSRREEFKNKFLQNQRRQIFRIIDKTLLNIVINPGKKLKREKLQQIDHYISMEVSCRQPETAQMDKLKKNPQRAYKDKSSKTERKGKISVLPAHLVRDSHEELKLEERLYLLNVPQEIKLNTGVTFRENQRYGHSCDNPAGNVNRKKLQFLKNEEMNPVKIKLSQLMSYKKITTMTNLAYCSSMKTVKEIPKEGTDSKISIDSRQFVEEPSGSKKLIKVANRKIYEQMLADFSEEGGDANFKKAKLKHKKEGKVRFDNVEMA